MGRLPKCPFDGKPCVRVRRGCETSYFDGEREEVIDRCPRLKSGGDVE